MKVHLGTVVSVDPPKKKRVNSKAKGSTFEREVAKKLTAKLQPLNFAKTEGSGARAGGFNFKRAAEMLGDDVMKIFVGDVVPVNERQAGVTFKHSLELKFYKDQDTFTQLASGSARVFSWFEESVVDAAKVGRNPLLVFKWNRTDTFVAVDAKYDLPNAARDGIPSPLITLLRHGQSPRALDIYRLDDLLEHPKFWYEDQRAV